MEAARFSCSDAYKYEEDEERNNNNNKILSFLCLLCNELETENSSLVMS